MICSKHDDTLRCITQPDHAHLAAELIRLWRIPGLVENPRRVSILQAASRHDDGWQGPDAAPRVDAQGNPHTFRTLPLALRVDTWQQSCRPKDRDDSTYARALVLRHSLELLSFYRDESVTDGVWESLQEDLTTLLDQLEVDRQLLDLDYRWLHLADRLSLTLCEGFEGTYVLDSLQVTSSGTTLFLEPFPLAGATRFEVASRSIPDRTYRDSTDLTMELVTARWERTEFRLRPQSDRESS